MTGILEGEMNKAKEGVHELKTKWVQNGPGACTAAFDRINTALNQINTGVTVDVADLPTWNALTTPLTNNQSW